LESSEGAYEKNLDALSSEGQGTRKYRIKTQGKWKARKTAIAQRRKKRIIERTLAVPLQETRIVASAQSISEPDILDGRDSSRGVLFDFVALWR